MCCCLSVSLFVCLFFSSKMSSKRPEVASLQVNVSLSVNLFGFFSSKIGY